VRQGRSPGAVKHAAVGRRWALLRERPQLLCDRAGDRDRPAGRPRLEGGDDRPLASRVDDLLAELQLTPLEVDVLDPQPADLAGTEPA
jgi:hypothetical protein